jgi:hypothetical protein
MTDAAKPNRDQGLPYWANKLPADDGDATGCNSSRFKCVLDGEAVLDMETGIVWEKSPSQTKSDFVSAQEHCYGLTKGERKGWHMPTIEQLTSLVDTSGIDGLTLPSGHPFTNVQSLYWSATTVTDYTTTAWGVYFTTGNMRPFTKDLHSWAWCVRGGQSHDAY